MASWEENRDFILQQEAAGKLTAGQANWLDWYRAAGSPSTKEEFLKFTGEGGVAGRIYKEFQQQQPADPPQPIQDYSKLSGYLTPDGLLRDDLTNNQLWEIVQGGVGVTENQLSTVGDLKQQANDRLNANAGINDYNQLSDYDKRSYDMYMGGGYTIPQMDQLYRTNGIRIGLPKPPGFDERVAAEQQLSLGGAPQQPSSTPQQGGSSSGSGGGGTGSPIVDSTLMGYATSPKFNTLGLFQNLSMGNTGMGMSMNPNIGMMQNLMGKR